MNPPRARVMRQVIAGRLIRGDVDPRELLGLNGIERERIFKVAKQLKRRLVAEAKAILAKRAVP